MSMFDLQDRVAIVTGGSDGIGRGIANGLADMGAHVAIVARQQHLALERHTFGGAALPRRVGGVYDVALLHLYGRFG